MKITKITYGTNRIAINSKRQVTSEARHQTESTITGAICDLFVEFERKREKEW